MGLDQAGHRRCRELWGFNDASYKTEPAVNFPAIDVPFASWYEEYSNEIGTLE